MDIVFRKYFWGVHLLFVALVALIAARTTNLFVESSLYVLSTVPTLSARSVVKSTSKSLAPLEIEKLAKILGLPVPAPIVASTAGAQPTAADLNAEPVKSGLRVKLLGTMVSALPNLSMASIQDMQTQRAQTYTLGDAIQSAEILDIERSRVIILNGGRKEFINNEAGDGALAPPPLNISAAVKDPTSNIGATIKAVSENEYEVPKQEIDKTLSNLNEIAMQARVIPAFKDGVSEGFKMFSIRPDSIYTHIGVQNGDVIRKINGYDMNSPEKALEVYSKLKDANRIDIELDRNGSILRKTYNIR